MTDQSTFRDALLDPSKPVPEGLLGAAHAPAGKRYSVYRNNVTHSLISALQTAFPLTRKVLGGQNFDTLAPIYVRAHPPTSPLMMYYGAEFPAFLETLPEVSKLGYLPDCARLDAAMRASYHAANTRPFDLEGFQQLPPEQMMAQGLHIAPSVRILRSVWPLFDIWRFNMVQGSAKPVMQAQDVMICRPEFDPEPVLLPLGAAQWLDHLVQGKSLGEAFEATLEETPEFDLAASLTIAFSHGVFHGTDGGQHV